MKQEILEAVKKAKEGSKPRNFTQSLDVVITIKDLDVRKPENRIDEEVFLPNGRGKKVKIAFIADGELALQAKNAGADLVISKVDLEELGKDRKEAKKMANRHDFFVAQADMMPLVGRFLGPVLGPRKKMPKPVPASAKPEPLMEKLKGTVKVRIKDQPAISRRQRGRPDFQMVFLLLRQRTYPFFGVIQPAAPILFRPDISFFGKFNQGNFSRRPVGIHGQNRHQFTVNLLGK